MPLHSIKSTAKVYSIAIWEITESLDELQAIDMPSTDYSFLSTITHPQKQLESFAARLAVRSILNQWQVSYCGLQKNEYNVPLLIEQPYKVSISHTTSFAVAIIHQRLQIGIDIEPIREKVRNIASKFLSIAEQAFCGQDLERLTLYWACKEAIYKYYGRRGLTFHRDMLCMPTEIGGEGFLEGFLFPQTPRQQQLRLHYQRFENHFIVWAIPEK
jgi:4'-phosphopantetheinyl transferase EntD